MTGKGGYIYILTNKGRTVLYIGVTANLYARIQQHKDGSGSVFTQRYRCTDLLYYEFYPSIEEAIQREKQLKNWKREWKEQLIQKVNPLLTDLSGEIEDMQ
ncbi:GIY-YIG nuclease family protein [Nafulsella turpanensis]|uniref:GIY-YIG nuclease family protein n=1 Tax=Nafulsella turpanensis TaxID=1265690 RepID=UPI00035C139A|nr:GIY-YIG nuclease family protein [Nafulsella turpanensis]